MRKLSCKVDNIGLVRLDIRNQRDVLIVKGNDLVKLAHSSDFVSVESEGLLDDLAVWPRGHLVKHLDPYVFELRDGQLWARSEEVDEVHGKDDWQRAGLLTVLELIEEQ